MTEKDRHYQSMGKPDFDTVHETITRPLQDCEVIAVSLIHNKTIV